MSLKRDKGATGGGKELSPAGAAVSLPPVIDKLTRRQRDVLNPIVQGRSNKEIARFLKLGEGTVKVHIAALFAKLGIRRRAAAAVAGARLISQAVQRADSDSRSDVERPSSARVVRFPGLGHASRFPGLGYTSRFGSRAR